MATVVRSFPAGHSDELLDLVTTNLARHILDLRGTTS